MRLPVSFARWRLVRIKFFMIAVTLFSVYLFVSYSVLQSLSSKKEMIKFKSSVLNLPNVVLHLDLKGSPPKIVYLRTLLPKLRELGVTGLLIEYEDMFPYEGKLANLSAKDAYGKIELQQFLKLAVQVGFDIIPLVQTFAHMEHVLKLQEFQHLRELSLYPDTICPSNSESQTLVTSMLEQVIKLHRTLPLKYIHIGCDEVYHMNKCKQCLKRNQTNTNLYVSHVKAITAFINTISPKTTVLIWDDMLRQISMNEWQTVTNLNVQPVYWNYASDLKVSHISLIMYHKRFDNIWIASAFKGADGPIATYPNLKKRFLNHLSWMELIQDYKFGGEQDTYNFNGIIMTGWSRYNHMNPPCELLPVSIPSLFLNLLMIQKFKNGENWIASDDINDFFNKNFNSVVSGNLHCSGPVDINNFDVNRCYFDGSDLYRVLEYCDTQTVDISTNAKEFLKDNTALRDNDINITHVLENIYWCNKTVTNLSTLEKKMTKILSRYYDKYVIEEYVNYKLSATKQIVNELYKNQRNLLKVQIWRRRHD